MTNTYSEDTPIDVKTFEEIRCIRCVLERLLTSLDPSGFKDYQLEKFSGSAEARAAAREQSGFNEKDLVWILDPAKMKKGRERGDNT
jgi:hypothetical protein